MARNRPIHKIKLAKNFSARILGGFFRSRKLRQSEPPRSADRAGRPAATDASAIGLYSPRRAAGALGLEKSGWFMGWNGSGFLRLCNDFARKAGKSNKFYWPVTVLKFDNRLSISPERGAPPGRIPAVATAACAQLPAPPHRVLRHSGHTPHPLHAGEDGGVLSRNVLAGRGGFRPLGICAQTRGNTPPTPAGVAAAPS